MSVELCWCSKGLIKDHPEERDGDRSVRPPSPSPPRSLPGAPGGVTARAGPALAPRAPGEDGGGRGGRGAEAGAAGGAAAPHEGEAAPERGQEAHRLALRQISSAPGSLELDGEGGREGGWEGWAGVRAPLGASLNAAGTYNSLGHLSCSLCNAPVKSELLWQTHVLGKQHREVSGGEEGAGLGRALSFGSTGTALGKGREWGGAAPPERGPGVRCSWLCAAMGAAGLPPGRGWEPAWLLRLGSLVQSVRGLKISPY